MEGLKVDGGRRMTAERAAITDSKLLAVLTRDLEEKETKKEHGC
jgi:hypothetical protein